MQIKVWVKEGRIKAIKKFWQNGKMSANYMAGLYANNFGKIGTSGTSA